MDGTDSGSCPVAGFGISGVEPSGSPNYELVGLNLCVGNWLVGGVRNSRHMNTVSCWERRFGHSRVI
jgi:hypothetical protein